MASIIKGNSGQPIQFETKPNVNGDDVLLRSEIIGSVNMSGGVPAGAIIERGGNTNGQYIKYADGTVICTIFTNGTFTPATTSGAVNGYYQTLTWNFPVNFINVPVASSGGYYPEDTATFDARDLTTQQLRITLNSSVNQSGSGYVYAFAIGRWY